MDAFEEYSAQYSSPEDRLKAELARETNVKKVNPQMLSGHLQGKFLEFVSRMIQPKYILEIGTFTGYSALCLAEGLRPNGKLHTIEINDEHESLIRKYFNQSAYCDQLTLHIGPAQEIIPVLNMQFDLIFIDAEKKDYIFYYEKALEILSPGGFILADNVLWYGKVLLPDKEADEAGRAIKEFNEHVLNDTRTENVILPVRDGLSIIRKK
jgi:predicted O-methyltransferase YrrM